MAQGLPAHDAYAERVVISAALLDPGSIPESSRYVEADDFYLVPPREIWRAVVDLDGSGRDVSMESVAGWLNDHGKLQSIGGLAAIAELVEAMPAIAAAHEYARTVAEKAAVRRTVNVLARGAAEGRGDIGDASVWLLDVGTRVAEATDLGRLSDRDPAATALVVAQEVHEGVLDRIHRARAGEDGAPGMSTGFPGLDYRIGRLQEGSLAVLGAATGVGKTGLAMRIALNVARDGLRDLETGGDGWGVAYATLEIPRAELFERAVADCAHIDCDDLFSGTVHDRDQSALTAALAELGRLPIVIDDSTSHSLATLRGLVRRASAKLGRRIRLLGVDYLQLVRANVRKGATAEEAIAEVSKGLRALAGDLGVAVLATSQFNRDYKTRGKDKPPQVSDLRGSGQIEQDARSITLLDRTTPEDVDPQLVDAHTPKARGGGHPGKVSMIYRKRTATWAEEADDANDPVGRSGRWSPRNDPPPRPYNEPAERDYGEGIDDMLT